LVRRKIYEEKLITPKERRELEKCLKYWSTDIFIYTCAKKKTMSDVARCIAAGAVDIIRECTGW